MAQVSQDSSAQVFSGSPRSTGSVFYAAVGTVLPTTSFATLNTTFQDLGYMDEQGLKNKEDRPHTDVFVWGGDLLVSLQEKYSRTMTFKAFQLLNENVLSVGYGHTNVSATPATMSQGKEIAVKMNAKQLDVLSWVFDSQYETAAGNNALMRIVIPIGQVLSIADVDMNNKTVSAIEATIKAYPDANGNHGYMYLNDGALTGGTVGGS